ncbi:LacI family DNA-binding transcriptional regulator [Streptomyces sp. NPDC001732]
MRTVAAEAGVSHQTVSRVVNGDPTVTDAVRRRVEAAMTALDYRPSAGARALVRGRTEVIGIVIPHEPGFTFSNDHLLRLIGGAQAQLTARDYGLLISTVSTPGDATSAFRPFTRRRQVDGLLIEMGAGQSALPTMRDAGHPMVAIGHTTAVVPSVHPDDEGGAYAVTQHLLALGHRRIGVIAGPSDDQLAVQARQRGLRRALADARAGLPKELVVSGDFTPESGHRAAEHLMTRDDPPTALLALNDAMAFGAMRWLRARGCAVPDDVSVSGFDDTAAAALVDPPLTTVALESTDLGRRAAQVLLDMLDGRADMARETIVPSKLVVRKSTAPPGHR